MARNAKPFLVIVAGVNGCGKSTFARAPRSAGLLLNQRAINPDDLTREVLNEFPRFGRRAANLVAVERAEKAVWKAVAEGQSVAVETVLSSKKFLPLVLAARARGYHVRLLFVALPDVDLAIRRVRARVASGGHTVPATKIRDRWGRAYSNLFEFLPHVDEAVVISNARLNDVRIVAEWNRRTKLLRVHDFGELPELARRLRPYE